MIHKILIASTNQGKILEIKELMKSSKLSSICIKTLEDSFFKEPDEPYDSFLENSKHKALYYGDLTTIPTICDDSGLCIEVLNGFPGVRTKDFSEKCGGFYNAFIELERLIANQYNTKAYFHTSMALYFPATKTFIVSESRCYGHITFPARGAEGFGFDPIFIPDGFQKSLAELGLEIKNQISHRSKAIKNLLTAIQKLS